MDPLHQVNSRGEFHRRAAPSLCLELTLAVFIRVLPFFDLAQESDFSILLPRLAFSRPLLGFLDRARGRTLGQLIMGSAIWIQPIIAVCWLTVGVRSEAAEPRLEDSPFGFSPPLRLGFDLVDLDSLLTKEEFLADLLGVCWLRVWLGRPGWFADQGGVFSRPSGGLLAKGGVLADLLGVYRLRVWLGRPGWFADQGGVLADLLGVCWLEGSEGCCPGNSCSGAKYIFKCLPFSGGKGRSPACVASVYPPPSYTPDEGGLLLLRLRSGGGRLPTGRAMIR
ncbi:hypothetical protein Taro_005541 [Colocasia esculenta]|uniref:Uncharacterized protein n=1 Tax=Colocasia esculenta TaxID=4460 RepID=A0A843TSM4_COLES|nr:hypothetical protein [Colocasia esculenta]